MHGDGGTGRSPDRAPPRGQAGLAAGVSRAWPGGGHREPPCLGTLRPSPQDGEGPAAAPPAGGSWKTPRGGERIQAAEKQELSWALGLGWTQAGLSGRHQPPKTIGPGLGLGSDSACGAAAPSLVENHGVRERSALEQELLEAFNRFSRGARGPRGRCPKKSRVGEQGTPAVCSGHPQVSTSAPSPSSPSAARSVSLFANP